MTNIPNYIWEPAIATIGVIASALLSTLSVVLSQYFARKTSKEVAAEESKREIEKLELTWKHERSATRQKEFSDMISSVYSFLLTKSQKDYIVSLERINVLRIKEGGQIARLLDMLYCEIDVGPSNSPVNCEKIEMLLAEIVDQYRAECCDKDCDD